MLEPTAVDVLSPDAPPRDVQREKSRAPRFPRLQILLAQGLTIVVSVLFAIPPDVQPSAAEMIRRMTSQPALLSTIGDVLLINKTSARMYANLADNARITRTKLEKELLKQ